MTEREETQRLLNKEGLASVHALVLRSDSRGDGLEEAWQIINVLHMDAMDRGESWPRALQWLNQWGDFAPKRRRGVTGDVGRTRGAAVLDGGLNLDYLAEGGKD